MAPDPSGSASTGTSTGVPPPGMPGPDPAATATGQPAQFDPSQIGTQQFDPTKPYQAPVLPQVSAAPPVLPQGPEPEANGASKTGASIAYGLDKALRGYMTGKAQGQAVAAFNLNKQTTALQGLYNDQAQQYLNLAKSGAPPDQIKEAQDRMNAAWQSYMGFVGQHVQPTQGAGKGGKSQAQQGNLLQRIFAPTDPAQVPSAVYEAMQKMGPPVAHDAAPYLTPQYQAQLQARRAQTVAQTQGVLDQAAVSHVGAQNELRYQELANKTSRTPEEDQELSNLAVSTGKADAGLQRAVSDAAQSLKLKHDMGQISDEDYAKGLATLKSKGANLFPKAAQVGSIADDLQQLYVANGHKADGSDVSPTDRAAAERWAIANHHPNITSSTTGSTRVIKTIGADGKEVDNIVQAPPTSKTTGSPSVPLPSGWVGAAAGSKNSPIPANAGPAAAQTAVQVHQQALNNGNTPRQAAAKAQAAATAVQQSYFGSMKLLASVPTGIAGKQSADATKVYNDENVAHENYMEAQKAAANPDKSAGDFALASSFTHAHVGRVTNFELEKVNNLGGAKMIWDGKVARIVSGELSDRQRNMLIQAVADHYTTIHNQAELYRKGQGGAAADSAGTGGGTGTKPAAPSSNFDPSKDFIVPPGH